MGMLTITRRTILKVTAGAASLPAMPYVARADTYPSRPVQILVGYAPGGPTDICGRLIAQWLSQKLGQQFVVQNRDGAGSNIATEAAIHADPDGYTLLIASSSNAINATLYPHLDFNYMANMVQIAGIMQAPSVLEVNPALPIKTTAEFIAYARAHPGKLDLGTAGNGSPPHMFAALFMYMTGVKLNVIGYRGGGPALVDLLSGQVQVMFEGITSSIGYLRANKLRPLGVTSAKRSAVLPDVPPIGDVVKGYDESGWFGLAAPKGTPQPVIDTLNRAVAAGLADPSMKAKMANLGAEPMPMGPAEFSKLMASETVTWGRVIRAADIHMD
jgi:tripartite-type tricarboxylate transporter receptor subunit TctC